MQFKVVRDHTGDRLYKRGDIRDAMMADVRHLIPQTLEPVAEENQLEQQKQQPAVDNKAEPILTNKNFQKPDRIK